MLMIICLTTSVGALRLYNSSASNSFIDLARKYSLNQSLVDSHLKGVPGLRTLTTGSLSGGNLQGLGGEANGALDAEILGLGTLNELLADLLEGGDLAAGKGDADFVLLLQVAYVSFQCDHIKYFAEYVLGLRRRSLPSLAFGKTF